jgi:chemotaxis protein MotB
MGSEHPEIVIVRRRSSHDEGHHGGAWKIAFADFMTAMMAFFLVLWIISATDKNTKTLIARYFNPVKVEEPALAQKGVHGAPEQDTDAPGADSGAPNGLKSRSDQGDSARGEVRESPEAGSSDPKARRKGRLEPRSAPPDPARPYPTMSEAELFFDPSGALDKIAGAPPPGPRVDPAAALKGTGDVGPSADEAYRDPYRPLGADKAINTIAADPGPPSKPETLSQDAGALAPNPPPAPTNAALAEPPRESPAEPRANVEDARNVAPPEPAAPLPAPEAKPAEAKAPAGEGGTEAGADAGKTSAAQIRAAAALLAGVKRRLGPESQAVPGPELSIEVTDEGVLVSLTDRQNFSMFALGSAEPQPRVVRMMDAIATGLEALPGTIVVRGHTDAHPYRSATYDNWRLSSARAQMAYYMLTRGGVPEKRFDRIEGFADHRLKDPAHPLAAENRRIEILLRERKP